MPRVAKAAHVLAKLRAQMGLYQRELAKRVGLSQRTVQDIERGILRLSRHSAVKISEGTGVSVEWLLNNDWKKPIQNSSGGRWSAKDVPPRSTSWSQLRPATRHYQLAPRAVLIDHYLSICSLIEGLSNPIEAIRVWDRCFENAVVEFLDQYPPIVDKVASEPEPRFTATQVTDPALIAELMLGVDDRYRRGIKPNQLKEVKDDIEALELTYEHPTGEATLIKRFWREVADGRPLGDVLKALQVSQEKESRK